MRYSAIAAATLFFCLYAVSPCIAGPDDGRRISVNAQEEENAETVPVTEEAPGEVPMPEGAPAGEAGLLTVKGIVTSVDADAHTMTVNTASGEMTFTFDEDTRFQSGLKAREMSDVTAGTRIAVLYDESDGHASLRRVMLVPDKSYGPTTGTYKSKSRHKKSLKSRHKKSVKSKHKKKSSGKKKSHKRKKGG